MTCALIQRYKLYKGIADKVTWLLLDWSVNIAFLDPQCFVSFSRFNCSYFVDVADLHGLPLTASFLSPHGGII